MRIRWLAMILILGMLWGCDDPPEPETISATEPEGTLVTTEPAVPSGLYDPENPLEQATGGALQVFPLELEDVQGIRFLGDDILVFSGIENTRLTLLSGEDRYIAAQAVLPCFISPEDPSVAVTDQTITYYEPNTHCLVTLDSALQETNRLSLPEQIGSDAALSPDCSLLYYCTENALRVLDPETGLDRPLAEMDFPQQRLVNIHQGGRVLECAVTVLSGRASTRFLSSETGYLLGESTQDLTVWTEGDMYLALLDHAFYRELICGSGHYGPSRLSADLEAALILPVEGTHGVILADTEDSGCVTLRYYNLQTGRNSCRLSVSGIHDLRSALSDSAGEFWFLCADDSQAPLLCRWDPARSETGDERCHLSLPYTSDYPDREGLQRCREIANTLSQKHGVTVRIGEDVLPFQPADYQLIPEYRVPYLEQLLMDLDTVLSRYPEGFLKRVVSETAASDLTICLAEQIRKATPNGIMDHLICHQYRNQSGDIFLAVCSGEDFSLELSHEVFHIIESRVFSACDAYDNWNMLNPESFQYDNSYIRNLSRSGQELLAGENRAFVDHFSMSYPREDRARIMAYAMEEGQESVFASPVLQKKLQILCQGIREAFGLKDASLPWEQYLDQTLPAK